MRSARRRRGCARQSPTVRGGQHNLLRQHVTISRRRQPTVVESTRRFERQCIELGRSASAGVRCRSPNASVRCYSFRGIGRPASTWRARSNCLAQCSSRTCDSKISRNSIWLILPILKPPARDFEDMHSHHLHRASATLALQSFLEPYRSSSVPGPACALKPRSRTIARRRAACPK